MGFRPGLRTNAESEFKGWRRRVTRCAVQKQTFSGTGSMNCGSGLQRVNYRILYFFHGRAAAVLAHGLTKKDAVPDTAIETALARKRKFEQGPALYTFEES